jgi:hypothetical protein
MPTLSKDDLLSNLYYDLESGYGSIQSLYTQAKENDSSILLEDVKTWMKKQPNKQRKNYKFTNSYKAPFPRFEYQIDIMDMNYLKQDSQRYGLCVIDIFSKLGDVQPLTNKDSVSVYNALQKSFKIMGFPMSIYSDDGGEFKGKVKEFFDGEGIKHIITLTHANVVERFIRTMKSGINDRINFNNGEWVEMLKYVLTKYNSVKHSATEYSPKEAHMDSNTINVSANLQLKQSNKRKYPNIDVNDYVKIYTKGEGKYISRKEYNSRWSDNKYKVLMKGRDIMSNTYYKLEGLTKEYLRHEILLINE